MKQTYSTCRPAGELDYFHEGHRPEDEVWYEQALADGAQPVREGVLRWCNEHIAVLGTKPCRKGEVVLDTEHPSYGTPATILYPSDCYPLVVVGGSSTGSHLFVAPIDESLFDTRAGTHNGFPVHDRTFTRAELLSAVQPSRAFRINRKKDGTYSGYVKLGVARYRRDWSD